MGNHLVNMEKRKAFTHKVLDYLTMYFLVGMASMPFFVGNEYLYIFFFFALLVFVSRKKKFDVFIFYYCLVYLLIFLFQSIFYSVFEMNIVLGYLLRILFAYVAIKAIGEKAGRVFVNIIYFFTLVSFVFYIPSLFFPDTVNSILLSLSKFIEPFQLNDPGRSHILIYTFGEEYSDTSGLVESSWFRNSGPFWEPGGFGIFLVLAILFELIETKNLFSVKNRVFFIAVITTLSTGTFFALFVLTILYLITYLTASRAVLLICFVVSAIFIYANTFFLNEKVEEHLSMAGAASLKYAPRNRFVSAQLDLIDFVNNPLLGRGRFVATRFDVKESREEIFFNHRSNGTSNMLVEFGFFGFVFFFICMYYSFKTYCKVYNFRKNFAFYSVLIVALLGFYEMIFNKPFFIGLSFMFLAAGLQKKAEQPQIIKMPATA